MGYRTTWQQRGNEQVVVRNTALVFLCGELSIIRKGKSSMEEEEAYLEEYNKIRVR